MRKTIVSLLACCALVLALVLPMTAFAAGDKVPVDGTYDVDYTLTGDGTMKLIQPARLVVRDGKCFVRLAWNDPEVDKLYLGDETLMPVSFEKERNIQGKLPVFEVPLKAFNEDQAFEVHSRGVNLDTDDYTLTVKAYDPDYDAAEKEAEVRADLEGAQPIKFYKWSVGKASSLWGPFALLAAVALAIAGVSAYFKKMGE